MDKKLALRVYSCYDFLNSTIKSEEYIKFLQKAKLKVGVLLNTNTLYELRNFYHLAKKAQIKPILGLTVPKVKWKQKNWEITFYPINWEGYQTVLELSSKVMIKPDKTLDLEELTENNYQNLILVFSCQNREIVELSKTLLEQFATEIDYYYGITNWKKEKDWQPILHQPKIVKRLLDFRAVRYLQPEEEEVYQTLVAIRQKQIISSFQARLNLGYYRVKDDDFFKQSKALQLMISQNQTAFLAKINLLFPDQKKLNLKKYSYPASFANNWDYLTSLCQTSLQKYQKGKEAKNYHLQLTYELEVIKKKKLVDYFLLVRDYVRFAKQANILIGPGRGSVAGSLVSFLLGITEVDPLLYDLIFERFLNPKQTKMPDIDIDIEDGRREEVLAYLVQKYGQARVAQIATFQKIAAKMALRDVGRVLELDLRTVDELAKTVSNYHHQDLATAIAEKWSLQLAQKKYPQLFCLAKAIIGLPRQAGVHAAGIVISEDELIKTVAVWKDETENRILQAEMKELKELGLLKMDLLGLKNLTIISQVLDQINPKTNKNLFLKTLPINDQATFKTLARGETAGIFQVESESVTYLLKRIKPEKLADLALSISLFRPGPIQHIEKFWTNKAMGKSKINYLLPEFEPILAPTWGIPIYQEQIIYMVKIFSQLPYSDGEILRNALGKKQQTEIKRLKTAFFQNSTKGGKKAEEITKVWEMVVNFTNYSFNRSHAVAYALIVYWMSYLKTYYLDKFLLFLLDNSISDDKKTEKYLTILRINNFQILPPQVNHSHLSYYQKDKKIFLPFQTIKQLGPIFAQKIVRRRAIHGLFTDPFDFVSQILLEKFNQELIKKLCASGSLDQFGYSRLTLLTNLKKLILTGNFVQIKGQKVDWELLPQHPKLAIVKEDQRLLFKNELLHFGFFLSYHLLEKFISKSRQKFFGKPEMVKTIQEVKNWLPTKEHWIAVIIKKIKMIQTKTGKKMAFLELSDKTGQLKVIVWPQLWAKIAKLEEGTILWSLIQTKEEAGANFIVIRKKFILEQVILEEKATILD